MGIGFSWFSEPESTVYPPKFVDTKNSKRILLELKALRESHKECFRDYSISSGLGFFELLQRYKEVSLALNTYIPQVQLLLSYPRVNLLNKNFLKAELQAAIRDFQESEDQFRDSIDFSQTPYFIIWFPRIPILHF